MHRIDRTTHARIRQAQRAVADAAIDAALVWGREVPAGGGDTFLFLGRREAARASRHGDDVRDHTGTTLVLLGDGALKTVWRSARPPRGRHAGCGRRGGVRR